MFAVRYLLLLLVLTTSTAFAESRFQVELIVFRQAGDPVYASQVSPADWSGGHARADENVLTLTDEAATLKGSGNYHILLHKAWHQDMGTVSLSEGKEKLGHHPIEGRVELSQNRYLEASVTLWINQLDRTGLPLRSEYFSHRLPIKPNALTYLDHGNLGALIRVRPL